MPESLGRVEIHCFGCESVFQVPDVRGVADQVFTELVVRHRPSRKLTTLLGYLRQWQRRYPEALRSFATQYGWTLITSMHGATCRNSRPTPTSSQPSAT